MAGNREEHIDNLETHLFNKNQRIKELEDALREADKYLKQGKHQFAPHTTNSLVDGLIEKIDKILKGESDE